MSGQLAMQEGKLILQDGKLGFCCCAPAACQWRVLFTYQCGECVGGVYASKGYVAGTPEKITADFQTPGDYPNEDNTVVMRYGASPAEACDTPAEGDLDLTTQPSVSPSPSPCLVDWWAEAELWDYEGTASSCDDCYSQMTLTGGGGETDLLIGSGKPDDQAIDCPAAGTRAFVGDCTDLGGGSWRCADYKYKGTCRKVCPPT